MKKRPEEKLFRRFSKKAATLSLAESCTGGLASSRVTDVPGSSSYFSGAVVAYSNDIKVNILKVKRSTIKKHGAVSPETAGEMARGVRRLTGTDIGASITGIAGPSGSRPLKPVGLAYAAFSDNKRTVIRKIFLKGGRLKLKDAFARALLEFILECM